MIDIIIMAYVVLMVILIYRAEKLPRFSLRIILTGLVLTPIIGAMTLVYYQRKLKPSNTEV